MDEKKYNMNETLASEIIAELKAANRRIFIALMVACTIICLMIGVVAVYLTTPGESTEETMYTVSQEDIDMSGSDNSITGIEVNGNEADGNVSENND